jgi:hypothetical protein
VATGEHVVRFGSQIDVRPLVLGSPEAEELALAVERAAGYFVKYVVKGTEDTGGSDVRIRHRSQIGATARSAHAAAVQRACWDLAGLSEFAGLNLEVWAHMFGYGGHPTTKSRRFSVTFGSQRAERVEFERAKAAKAAGRDAAGVETVRVASWAYAGSGWPTAAVSEWAAWHREDAEKEWEERRRVRAEQRAEGRAA